MDNPGLVGGRDKHVPPRVEGHASRARGIEMDNPGLVGGRDKRVPPTNFQAIVVAGKEIGKPLLATGEDLSPRRDH